MVHFGQEISGNCQRKNEMRDDFSTPTKRTLAERAGFICSNPDCRRKQLGPAPGDPSKSVNLGKAAHICAAASGGPRFDETQTQEQRTSLGNAIFLCGGCADLIDKNGGVGHPAAMLHSWKQAHEAWVTEQLNKGELDRAEFAQVIWQEVNSAVGTVGSAHTVNIIQNGLSYPDVRQIALDVFKSNYLQLSESAAEVARQRATEITDAFLKQLEERNPNGLASVETPGMQHAIFSAQKEYARTGDKDIEALLVDILVDRTGAPERSLKQIVLDEALSVIPKLTSEQLDALTVFFLISRTMIDGITSLTFFLRYLDESIAPFIQNLTTNSSCYDHLVYTGCGSIAAVGGVWPVGEFFGANYPGLFSHGFNASQWESAFPNNRDLVEWAVIDCRQDPSRQQINAVTEEQLLSLCDTKAVAADVRTKLVILFNTSRMTEAEIKAYILRERPALQKLFTVWEDTPMRRLSVTTVGIAVAQANFRRRTSTQFDLGIWVK